MSTETNKGSIGGLTPREFAKRIGVRPIRVKEALEHNWIRSRSNGLINPVEAERDWKLNTPETKSYRPEMRRAEVPQGKLSSAKVAREARKQTRLSKELGEELGMAPADAEWVNPLHLARINQVQTKTKLDKIELMKLEGSVVDRQAVSKQVNSLARSFRDRWVNWPSRVAAELAADVGVDHRKMLVALEKHVRKNLAEMSRLPDDITL